jgi:hypothetical protein
MGVGAKPPGRDRRNSQGDISLGVPDEPISHKPPVTGLVSARLIGAFRLAWQGDSCEGFREWGTRDPRVCPESSLPRVAFPDGGAKSESIRYYVAAATPALLTYFVPFAT